MHDTVLRLLINLLVCSLLAGAAAFQKALTTGGVLLAWISAVLITFCGGLTGFLILAATFFFTVLAGKIGKEKRAFEKQIHAKTGRRDHVQVFCNVGVGTLLLLAGYFLKNHSFLSAYAAVMAGSLADSMASELGVLSRSTPMDLCTMKKTVRGLSGGVTVAGLLASLLGASLIAAIYVLCSHGSSAAFLKISLCGFGGSLFDSVLGSLLQVKYRCSKCGMLTEKPCHCGVSADRIRGCAVITNDTVNLLSNIAVAASALCLFVHGS